MTDPCVDVFHTQPARLAEMLEAHWDDAQNWAADELSAILRHQMTAPLSVDLANHRYWLCYAGDPGAAPQTFEELFRERRPPLELLRGVKDFAKGHLRERGGKLPREIARVLYYGSVLVARLVWGERITRRSDVQVQEGLVWAVAQPWLEPWLQDLFRRGQTFFRRLEEGAPDERI